MLGYPLINFPPFTGECSTGYVSSGSSTSCRLSFDLGCPAPEGALYPEPGAAFLVLYSQLDPDYRVEYPAEAGPVDFNGAFSYECSARFEVSDASPKGLGFEYRFEHGPVNASQSGYLAYQVTGRQVFPQCEYT